MQQKSEFDPSHLSGNAGERRAAVLREEQERAEARRREIEEQSSVNHLPSERIRIWERLHALRLPVSESHPLVAVIAEQTHLSIKDVRQEQQERRLGRMQSSAPPAVSGDLA